MSTTIPITGPITTSTTGSAGDKNKPLSLFPLGTVLFPDGRMALKVFEQRYLTLIKTCLKNDEPFGVVWIREGHEVAKPGHKQPKLAEVGVTAKIVDWHLLPGNLLGVIIEGGNKFSLLNYRSEDDGLVVGEVELLAQESTQNLSEHHQLMQVVLEQLLLHPSVEKLGLELTRDTRCLANNLSQLLPVDEADKYSLLLSGSVDLRLKQLDELIEKMAQ